MTFLWIGFAFVGGFKDEETAMQLHVPVTDHINAHQHCLHLWRPQHGEIVRPPSWMIA